MSQVELGLGFDNILYFTLVDLLENDDDILILVIEYLCFKIVSYISLILFIRKYKSSMACISVIYVFS